MPSTSWATSVVGAFCDVAQAASVQRMAMRFMRTSSYRERGVDFVAAAATAKVELAILVVTLDGGSSASFDLGLALWYAFFSTLAFAVLASVTFAAAAVARLHDEEARRARAELLRAKSELKALRA